MTKRVRVVINADHGGTQGPGVVYYDKRGKDDVLRLALTVGQILSEGGVDVVYTRVSDTYDTPFEKAMIVNNSGADYFVSPHRSAVPTPSTASGPETLVYEDSGVPALVAKDINEQSRDVGFLGLGMIERPGLMVLRRAEMPAVLVEAGFIDNEADNRFFDDNFEAIVKAVAQGILDTVEQEQGAQPQHFQIQIGAYRNQALTERQAGRLEAQGFPAFVVYGDGLYKVRAGVFLNIGNTAQMERDLREYGYNTFMVRPPAVL